MKQHRSLGKLLAAGFVLAGLAGYNNAAQAGACQAIDLPTATAANSVTFTNAISYSLPILGLNYNSSPGNIQDCIVVQTGSSGAGINTNGPGIDNAYPAPNGTSTNPFALTPWFSSGNPATPVFSDGGHPNPSFPGQTLNTWDISVSALRSFLTANGGTDPIIMFNHNQTNSGGAIDQNLFIWAQVALADTTGMEPTKYFYVAAETNPTGVPNFGLPGGNPTAITGPQTAATNTYPLATDGTGTFPLGGFCGTTGAPDCGTQVQYMIDAQGQVCLNGPVGAGQPIPCNLPGGSPNPAVVATVNENLGANQVANAIIVPGLNAILDNPALLGSYDTIQVDLREGCNGGVINPADTTTPGSGQVPGCPDGSPLNNGFEQIFLVAGNLGLPPEVVPEPSSLALIGSGLIGFGWVVRRRRRLN